MTDHEIATQLSALTGVPVEEFENRWFTYNIVHADSDRSRLLLLAVQAQGRADDSATKARSARYDAIRNVKTIRGVRVENRSYALCAEDEMRFQAEAAWAHKRSRAFIEALARA